MIFDIRKFQVIITDFDDVILNTFPQSSQAVIEITREFGDKAIKKENVIACWGGSLEQYYDKLAKHLSWSNKQKEYFTNIYNNHHINYGLCEGVKKFLEYCQQNKIHLGILTNRDKCSTLEKLSSNKVDPNMFFHISGAPNENNNKSQRFIDDFDPLLQQMNISISEVLYIDDSLSSGWPVARDHQPPVPFLGKVTEMVPAEEFNKLNLPNFKSFYDIIPSK